MKLQYSVYFVLLFISACTKENEQESKINYSVGGSLLDSFGNPIDSAKIIWDNSKFTFTDINGDWIISELTESNTIRPFAQNYKFNPQEVEVSSFVKNLDFVGSRIPSTNEKRVLKWLSNQQLSNGLLESVENGNVVSLYDNALAALVFMMRNDFEKAEKIFDFFNGRIDVELTQGPGGFSQLRNRIGIPRNHRWMGDNAWLLIALNNYRSLTGKSHYDNLITELSSWLMGLQDDDGGLFAGYNANNELLAYKVTEGNIDAFNAIGGYTEFHSNLLGFLKNDRWDADERILISWPTNPKYIYALDLHPWSYSMFNDFPITALTTANWFITTQTATTGANIKGFCFDEDKDVVWPEGTGQMALAFGIARMQSEKQFYLNEMERVFIKSTIDPNTAGFPYASNLGTAYGAEKLWAGADTEIAISGGAWYLFAKFNFNPFAVGRDKIIPSEDMFWTK